MFNALTVRPIEFQLLNSESIIIEPDSTIVVKDIGNGLLVGVYNGLSFDIYADEYVKTSGILSILTH